MKNVVHITANSRLTRFLKQQLLAGQWQDQTVVRTPEVMTWSQWWAQWMQAALLRGDLPLETLPHKTLSAFEAQLIWETLLDEKIQQQPELALLNQTATAKQLYQAWCFFAEYFPAPLFDEAYITEEVRLFLDLKETYLATLEKHHWADAVLQQQQQLKYLKTIGSLPEAFHLHGFDEIPPFMRQWIEIVQAGGTEVKQVDEMNLSTANQQWLYTALNPQDEIQQIVLWCAEQLKQQYKIKPLHAIRIAVVAPNLADIQHALSWALDEVLYQQFGQALPLKSARQPLYNMSLGTPLSQTPIVKNALQTLALAMMPDKTLAYADWSSWLTSPYTLGSIVQRQKADVRCRRLQWASFKWPNLLNAIQQKETEKAQTWLPKSLINLLDTVSDAPRLKTLSLSQFIAQAEKSLQQFRWADSSKERSLSSIEMQQKETFLEALASFAQLNMMQPKQSVSGWLGLLKRYLNEKVHQPQTQGIVPIQIMGTLEAGGQAFDSLWVMGLIDEAWPRPPNPNPFLPMALQRMHGLPRSDALRELEYAKQVTMRLAKSSPEIVWSYPQQLEDRVALPSPLLNLAELQNAQAYDPISYQSLARRLWERGKPLEWVEDTRGPEVPLGSRVPGGSGILTAQNKCPLMAFMDFRLGARQQLEEVEEGMRSNHLGTLVHAVLEAFWRQVQDQQSLLQMADESVSDLVLQLLEEAMMPLKNQFDEHYLSLEQNRIQQLILDWLALEKARPNFKVVAFEENHTPTIGGIEFNLKIDRVDDVFDAETGALSRLILDYKTGKASVGDLLKEPIEAPQLAVYLHAYHKAVAGLGYGILHSDDGVKFNTLISNEGVMLKDRSQMIFAKLAAKEGGDFEGMSWSDFLQALRDEVSALATQIQQGQAEMTFRKETDLTYAASLLALRLPEVTAQMGEQMLAEEEETE
ncbi:PD-(D/E)XK nuclease family protein [Hydrogenovibrio sp. 3SP14C1]|uniref:PD-(D/E)XK nuclease family protein n=1 Tax=Hydrogenovibrio sp. 3SP14C1 TaxID=3038774 RepID=UPI002416D59A|nr:PD-(D/E)XK nuclease family protein [Hydrogenovibrio sp. 3SP14C1]MDG4812264.1 PD-(D/E)XK nuclease family protein [Hydrogenovibrio sp. 3SP14C1]